MLDFMIIAFPRSGTTWAANWLTDGHALCAHDPLWTLHYSEFDDVIPRMAAGRLAGISCSGIWKWPAWLNAHPARKVILHRDVAEVRESMHAAGYRTAMLDGAQSGVLDAIEGLHAHWADLFDSNKARALWAALSSEPFDTSRHAQLVQMKIQPEASRVSRDMTLNRRLAHELGIESGRR